jgi:hypothetical protein
MENELIGIFAETLSHCGVGRARGSVMITMKQSEAQERGS